MRAHRDALAIDLPPAAAAVTLALQIVERAVPEARPEVLPDFSI